MSAFVARILTVCILSSAMAALSLSANGVCAATITVHTAVPVVRVNPPAPKGPKVGTAGITSTTAGDAAPLLAGNHSVRPGTRAFHGSSKGFPYGTGLLTLQEWELIWGPPPSRSSSQYPGTQQFDGNSNPGGGSSHGGVYSYPQGVVGTGGAATNGANWATPFLEPGVSRLNLSGPQPWIPTDAGNVPTLNTSNQTNPADAEIIRLPPSSPLFK
jgi:hypothetical protein